MVLAFDDHVPQRICSWFGRRRFLVAERHEPPPVVVPSQVEHDRSQVRRCFLGIAYTGGRSMEPDERLLNEVLGSPAIIGEEASEPHERTSFLMEQSYNQIVGRCISVVGEPIRS
jgi:hypothetical protein